ncbi:MAG: fibro-slime domain-containing protein [Myxococcales bacterium]|jgi:fibro-slime domain-containing protein|nr:fibro-slime domain-containing protein [Myxococcales bacterium]MBL0194110.1 fibro-slime domain-containing protein [Myxococcales bacterium]HQY60198.1 fibro-slime domain-containing protein [Polyangiaceae bacterium]
MRALHRPTPAIALVALVALAFACGTADPPSTFDAGDQGQARTFGDGGATPPFPDGGRPPEGCGSVVTGVVRDFRAGGDFQCTNSGYTDASGKECGPWDPDIVGRLGSRLGPGRKPVFAAKSRTLSTTNPARFPEWFADTPGVNLGRPFKVTLVAGASGTSSFDTPLFFPIDGELLASSASDPDRGPYKSDDGRVRNFHFTYELHTTFRYDRGNVFAFRGDDDVFVYVNDRLAVNLGGIHVPMSGKIALDTGRVELTVEPQWASLVNMKARSDLGLDQAIPNGVAGTVDLGGLAPGGVYALDFFFAERNCCGSNFRVETNLAFVDCGSGTVK